MPSFLGQTPGGDAVVFIHVPKTGGTSITDALREPLNAKPFDAGACATMVAAAPDYQLAQRLIPYGHARACDVRDFMGPRAFDEALRFAFLRDPVEHALSGWAALTKPAGLDAWLTTLETHRLERLAYSQWPFVLDDDETLLVPPNGLYSYEALLDHLRALCIDLSIATPSLPRRNPAPRPRPKLTREQEGRIRELFARDYALLRELEEA